ncbi:MAG TPA: thiamine-phosphate kinase [Thermoanaerobaculia bacterium]|nr:thiamine-phosphate kinase [Thermoanaerobaculia bacterium]
MTEAEIIERIRQLFPQRGAKIGIGDDAAVVGEQAITVDMLIEDVDFKRSDPVETIARKSLVVNLSDLAAMGAIPAYAVVALGLPPWLLEKIDPFLRALADCARKYDIDLVGGDLSRAEKAVIAITATGWIEKRPLLRSGAKPGDRIFVSRPLGASQAGLQMLRQPPPGELPYALREFVESAIARHLDPEPEVQLGVALASIDAVSACIDISDGLSTDLHHLCDASGAGADIERARIPVFPDLERAGPLLGIDVRHAVLDGGEEFALLFTSTLRESELSSRVGRPVYAIGRIVAERSVRIDGAPLAAGGFNHFA